MPGRDAGAATREIGARWWRENGARCGGVSHVCGAPRARVVRASLTRFWGARVLVGWEDGDGAVGGSVGLAGFEVFTLHLFTLWSTHLESSRSQVVHVDGSRQLTADLQHHGGGGGRA